MRNSTRLILLNITGCILFLALPLLFVPGSSRLSDELTSPPTLKDIIAYSLLIGYFYLNFFVLVPKLYFKHRYFIFGLLTILCFSLITALPNVIFPQNKRGGPPPRKPMTEINSTGDRKPPPDNPGYQQPPAPPPGENDVDISLLNHISHHLFLFLGVFFFSLLLKINNRWKKAEEEKINTELSYLKAQINPHFLFNTLNSIYSLALEKSDNAATAVVKLSDMMRYVLSDANKTFVSLEQEINYISSYIELQKIRYGDDLPLTYTSTGSFNGKKIAPLILIPFVENAFKHGVNAEEGSAIKIELLAKENELHIMVVNNKVHIQIPEENKTGVGIENAKKRLNLLYPGKHTLTISDNNDTFFVALKLELE